MNQSSALDSHMIAHAKLTAHFIAAAVRSNMSRDEINSVLRDLTQETVISEFWVTDEHGQTAYQSEDVAFTFPTHPDAGTQSSEFAGLLMGDDVVVQDAQPRELDGKVVKYVGVAGVDSKRIVQVGIYTES